MCDISNFFELSRYITNSGLILWNGVEDWGMSQENF